MNQRFSVLIAVSIISQLIKDVFCGQIYGTEILVKYPIATQATQYSFNILLETILKSTNYLRIKWPYQLEYLIGEAEVQITVQDIKQVNAAMTTNSLTIQDNTYHFQFSTDLLPYTWYTVKLVGVINLSNSQTVGFQNLVSIATVTSTVSNAIVIDSNPLFGLFALSTAPPNTATIVATYAIGQEANMNVPGKDYLINLQLKTLKSVSSYDQDHPSGVNYEVSMTDVSFQFKDPQLCVLLNRPVNECTCDFSAGQKSKLLVSCKSDLIVENVNTTPIQIEVSVINSMRNVQNTEGFSLEVIYPPTSLIVETGTLTTFFKVSSITLQKMQIKLMHGIPYTSSFSSSYEVPLGLYIPSNLNPMFQPFNSVRVIFQIQIATNSNFQLLIEGSFNQAEAILESSIIHNLPQFNPANPIKCKFDYISKVLSCKGVGALLTLTDYYISARIAFSSSPTLSVDTDGNSYLSYFGGIQVKSVLTGADGNIFYGEVSAVTYATNQIYVFQNTEFSNLTPATGTHTLKNFGANIVSSAPLTGTFSSALLSNTQNGAKIGILPSISPQRLIFYVQVQQAQQTYQDFLGFKQQTYMKMIYNDNVIQMDPVDLANGIEIQNSAATNGQFSAYSSGSAGNQINQQLDLTNQNLFKYAYLQINTQRPVFGGDQLGFGFKNVKFPSTFKSSQFVADDRVLDFLLCFMYKDDSRGAASTNKLLNNMSMLFHGYTIYPSYINNNFEAAFTNIFIKKKEYNKGQIIPTMLRIFGTLSALEISSALTNLKIALIPDRSVQKFFDMNQFDVPYGQTPNEGCGGTTQSCYSYEDGGSQKITSPPDNWSLNPFIVLDLPSVTVQIQEAVAILLKPLLLPKTLNIAIIQIQSSGVIEVYNVIRVYGASLGLSNFATDNRYFTDINTIPQSSTTWDQISNYSENSAQVASTYSISSTQSLPKIVPSGSASTFLFLSTHTDSGNLISVNVQASMYYGSGFTISSIKNDLIGTSQLTSFPGTTNVVSKCIQKFKYKVSTVSNPYYNYVVYCPYDANTYTDGAAGLGMTFTNFKFPNVWGVGYPLSNTFAYSWSGNNGKLIDMKQEVQIAPASAKAQGCLASGWSPVYQLKTNRQQIQMTITPSVSAQLISINDFYKVQLSFTTAFPAGMIFLSQCSVQTVSTPTSNIYPDYTTCAARITATKIVTFVIQKQTDDGQVIAFNPTNAFTINFFISHSGNSQNAQTFTVQIIYNSYLQDDCVTSAAINVPVGNPPASLTIPSMTINNLICYNPTIGANTIISWTFSFIGRDSVPDTTIRFSLGFLSTPKMLQNLDCQVLEQQSYTDYFPEGVNNGLLTDYKPTDKFSQINYNSQTNTIDLVIRGQYAPPLQPFLMKCYGFKTPSGDNTQDLSVQWIDTQNQNQIIQQSTTNIKYFSLALKKAKTMTAQQLKLVSKVFTAPGFEAVYTIQFIPMNVRMTSKSIVYVEFSVGYMQKLNQKANSPECTLNGANVACLLDQNNARRLVIYPLYGKNTALEPLNAYILVIAGIQQPQSLDSYGYIWFGIDADDDLSNGLQEQGDIKDLQVQQSKITYLQSPSYSFSSFKTRQQRVMLSFNFTCSTRTITNNRMALLRLHPAFFNSQLAKVENDIECTFYREGDPKRTNFTTSCERIYGNSFLRMNLTVDDYNTLNSASYWIQIFYLPSPDYQNSQNFPLFLNLFITDMTMNTILYAVSPSLTQTPVPISFLNAVDTTKNIMWYGYNQDVNVQQTVGMYNQWSGRDRLITITIYRGIITKTAIYLSFDKIKTFFDIDYTFYFVDTLEFSLFDIFMGKQSITSNSIQINTGDDGIKISIAAKVSTPLGIYTLELKKIGLFKPFEDPEISPLPNLVVNVLDIECQISLSSTTLSVPQGTRAGPIVIDFSSCMPSQNMIVLAQFNPAPAVDTDIMFDTQQSQIISFVQSNQAIYYFTADASTTISQTYNVQFSLSGVNANQFVLTSNSLRITVTAPLTKKDVLIASYSQIVSTDQSKIDISAQCNQNGYLYWAVAINENYLNNALFTTNISLQQIQQQTSYTLPSNIVSLKYILTDMRYKNFFWVGQSLRNDQLLARQYGYLNVFADTTFTLSLQNLPQRSMFSFTSYCVSVFNEVSTAKTSSWQTSWRLDGLGNPVGQYTHLQIDLTFTKVMSNDQLNNIQCQLQQALEINVYSLSTSSCILCDQSKNYTLNTANYQDLNFSPTVCPLTSAGANPIIYTFYAWSGEQSTGLIIDIPTTVQAALIAVPCFFVNVLNYSLDLDIVKSFTNIFKLTPITPQPISNIQLQLDLIAFQFTDTNVTISLTSLNAPGFLIVGAHTFYNETTGQNEGQSQQSSSDSGSQTLTPVQSQPTPLKLRQGLFGDGSSMNLLHKIIPINSAETKNITVNLTLNHEYLFYWTLSSYESCADSLYAPIGFKQFIFKGISSNTNILQSTIQLLLIEFIIIILS